MSTAVVKNIGAAVLVFGALILVLVVFGGGSSPTSSRPVSATLSTGAVAPPTTDPTATISCPAGTVARAVPGPAPTQAVPGYMWSPASYPTSGWCETRA
jgi:hypothetical protein